MRFTLISQLALIAISLVVLIAFVKPMFVEIGGIQNELQQYNDAIAKASEFIARLQELDTKRDSFSSSEKDALDTFIPARIDQLKTMNEIQSIFDSENLQISSLTATEEVVPNTNNVPQEGTTDDVINYQDFLVTFIGTYQQMKDTLNMIESDATLLEVQQLSFGAAVDAKTPASGSTQNADAFQTKREFKMMLRTYGLAVASQ